MFIFLEELGISILADNIIEFGLSNNNKEIYIVYHKYNWLSCELEIRKSIIDIKNVGCPYTELEMLTDYINEIKINGKIEDL